MYKPLHLEDLNDLNGREVRIISISNYAIHIFVNGRTIEIEPETYYGTQRLFIKEVVGDPEDETFVNEI